MLRGLGSRCAKGNRPAEASKAEADREHAGSHHAQPGQRLRSEEPEKIVQDHIHAARSLPIARASSSAPRRRYRSTTDTSFDTPFCSIVTP